MVRSAFSCIEFHVFIIPWKEVVRGDARKIYSNMQLNAKMIIFDLLASFSHTFVSSP